MTARPVIASAVVLAAAVATMSAAPGWMSKPYNTWTDLELKEVLNDSPWADKGSISYVKTNGASSQPIEDVVVVSWVSALPMRQAALRQQMGATPTPSKEAEAVLAQTITNYVISVKVSGGAQSSSYASNASVMQAETFLRRDGKPPLAAVQSDARMLDKDGKVVEMPAPRGGGPAPGGPGGPAAPGGSAPPAGRSQQMGVVPSAFQRGGGGGGIGGGGGGFGGPPGGGGGPRATTSVMLYMFPKTDAITSADKEVELVTKLCSRGFGGFGGGGGRGGAPGAGAGAPPAAGGGANCQYNVKKKFKLKDMVYNGELAL